jgi:HK97 family phage major capsid protein
MDRLTELRGRRMELAQRANALRAKSERSADEDEQYTTTLNQIQEVDTEIEREERFLQSEAREADYLRAHPPVNGGGNEQRGTGNEEQEQRGNVATMRIDGEDRQVALRTIRMRGEERNEMGLRIARDVPVYSDPAARAYFSQLRSRQVANGDFEFRAFQADSPTEGGYLSRGEQFVAQLIQAVDDAVFIRQAATVMQVNDGNTSLGVPTLDTDAEDTDWTVELDTGNEEDTIRFGKRSLTPHPLAKLVKISRELLRASALPAENIVLQRVAYKFGITQEKGFLTGTGAQQPLGVFTASNDGISTGRDVSTGNDATSIQFDGLQEAKFTLKSQYWTRARWMFHRNAVKQIAKLKDGEGRYMWEPSVRAGVPDQLFSFPFDVNENAPSTFTSGQYVGILADWSYYWIADSLEMQMQRLVELYARANQIGFIGRLQTDGMPVLEEAFVRVKLG